MMNLQGSNVKMSHLEKQINGVVSMLIGILCILCFVMALMKYSFARNSEWDNIFVPSDESASYKATLSFFTYFLLLHSFLPISLQVTIEMVKAMQAWFISQDAYAVSFDDDFNAIDNDPKKAEEDAYKFI